MSTVALIVRAANTTAGRRHCGTVPGGGRQRKHGKENQQKHGEGARAGGRPPVLAAGCSSPSQKSAICEVRRDGGSNPASRRRPQARRSDGPRHGGAAA